MKVKVKFAQLCSTLCDPMDSTVSPCNCPGQNTGVGSLSLLQVIFLTQVSNPGLLPCRQILCQLSHKGSPQATWCGKKKKRKKAEGSEWFKNEEHLSKVTFCTDLEFAIGFENMSHLRSYESCLGREIGMKASSGRVQE